MAENIYDEIEIEDMTFDSALQIYHYPCPCGDRFEIAIADLRDKEDIAVCPSCSLMIRVIFDVVSLPTHILALPVSRIAHSVTQTLTEFSSSRMTYLNPETRPCSPKSRLRFLLQLKAMDSQLADKVEPVSCWYGNAGILVILGEMGTTA